ncbi:hypothetical protein ACF0H5_007226 [Mactra antiquata]
MLFLSAILCVALVTAEEVNQDNRAIVLNGLNCGWQPNSNPCLNNVLSRLNFPHPSDPTKFLQCGTFSRLFVVQCPANEVYDQATTSCVKKQSVVVSQPLVNPVAQYGMANPCSAKNILVGRLFFSVPSNQAKFIQCDANGNAFVLTCPNNTLWSQNIQSCVCVTKNGIVVGGTSILGTGAGSLTGFLATSNPCTPIALQANQLYFSHPDPSKFIQCDLQGNAFVQNCPAGLVWNQYSESCASQLGAYNLGVINASG